MTLIQDTLEAIIRQGKEAPDLDSLPLDDPETYKLYADGDTDGIFQVESSGMRQYLRQLKPTAFEDLIAMLALYRPGTLRGMMDGIGVVDGFIKRKHRELPVTYPLPILEECLRDTYGFIVYQEQVMQIGQIVASYTLGQADLLRRAMGKKKAEDMAQERSRFVEGAKANGIDDKKANEIFDLMEKFAEYGFNKSHSAAYALISYHTAYLKAHFKVEFMAALLTSAMDNQDKLLKYVTACKDMDIEVAQPSVNRSRREFTAHGGQVVFGLGGIKNVGGEAVNEIVEAREQGGEFASLLDLALRVNLRKVTRRVLEALVKGGACDCFGISRAALLAGLDPVVARAQKRVKEKASSQVSLLSMAPAAQATPPGGLGFACAEGDIPEMEEAGRLKLEKEALGFFLTSHPLQPYRREMERLGLTALEEARELSPGSEIRCAVLVTEVKEVFTKSKGERMARVSAEDLSARAEIVFFPSTYLEVREILGLEEPLEITARLEDRKGETPAPEENGEEGPREPIKLVGQSVKPLPPVGSICGTPSTQFRPSSSGRLLSGVNADSDARLSIDIPATHLDVEHIHSLAQVLANHPGSVEVQADVRVDAHLCTLLFSPRYRVQPGPDLRRDLQKWTE
jgi:DNA polymerase-3 subunit alpha